MRPIRLLLIAVAVLAPRGASPQGGSPQGPEFPVNTTTALGQSAPSTASDGFGDFVVVWQSVQDGSGYGIFAQRYAGSGLPQGPEFRVNTFTPGDQLTPVVASDLVGGFVVLWTSDDGSGRGVFAQRYTSAGAPAGSEFRVNSFTTGDQHSPSAGFDKLNAMVAVWASEGQDGSGSGVFGQRLAIGGIPIGPEFRANTATAGTQGSPSVAANMAGAFVVAWESDGQDGLSFGVFAQRYLGSGAPAGAEFRVNSYTPQSQRRPAVSPTLSNFVIVWQDQAQDASSYGVFGQRYGSTGAPLGVEFRVNSNTAGDQSEPDVTSDSTGAFAVVWTSAGQDGSGAGVFGQRFAAAGTTLGNEFRVNSYTTSDQRRGSVASPLSNNFVVVWQSDGQDGSSYGVFAQRYAPIVPVELLRFGVE